MESTYYSPSQLGDISTFLNNRRKGIDEEILNLSIDDVRTDEAFEKTTKRIKGAILLTAISFPDPPKVVHHENVPNPYFNSFTGGSPRINIVDVKYTVTGSHELLQHRPPTYGFSSSSNMRIYQPDFNSITVSVNSPNLDEGTINNLAGRAIQMTQEFAASNNAEIADWNKVTEVLINSKLNARREELKKIY